MRKIPLVEDVTNENHLATEPELVEYARVRALLHDPAHYNGWGVNLRPPEVGNIGIIIDILRAQSGAVGYVVEGSRREDGENLWLSDFSAEELEAVDDAEAAVARARRRD